MTTIVKPLPHDLAVVAALETIGRQVGFANAPDGALDKVRQRTGPDYFILYPLSVGGRDGPLSDPYADAEFVYQVTVVGRLPDGVQHLVGLLEPALQTVQITGRAVQRVEPSTFGPVSADRDLTPPVFFSTPRYTITTTPA